MTSPYKSASSDPMTSPYKPASSDPMTSPYSAPMASSDPPASPDKSPSPNPVASVMTAPPAPLHFLVPAVQLLAKTQELLVELVLVRHLHVVAPVAGGYGPPVAAVAVVAVVDPSPARVVVPPSPVVPPATVESNEEEVVRFILGLVKFGSCCINYGGSCSCG